MSGAKREREREREREGGSGQRFAVSIFAECENVQDDLISGPADWHREHGTISSPTAAKLQRV